MNATEGSPDQAHRRAWRSPLAWVVLLSVVALGLAADLGLKVWSFRNVAPEPIVLDAEVISQPYWHIPAHPPTVVIPGVLHLHLVKNEGAVFGIRADRRMFFLLFTFAALAASFAVFGRWPPDDATVPPIACALPPTLFSASTWRWEWSTMISSLRRISCSWPSTYRRSFFFSRLVSNSASLSTFLISL